MRYRGRIKLGYEFVRCILVDFSKAFDTVNHSQLIGKLRQFDLPDCVLKWIVCFLTDRSQLVFAYPFHFGKSGFSAYFFTPNPDIRILSGFFCAGPHRPL